MDTPFHLQRSFARLGQRIRTTPLITNWRQPLSSFDLDVARDRHGEYFLLRLDEDTPTEFQTLDVQPDLKQLLLMARTADGEKQKFLCGFDERHLFTAAVPGQSIHCVRDAMTALKPALVRAEEGRVGLRQKDRLRRRNNAFVRQGEWFFIPAPDLIVPAERIRRHEPLRRGGGGKAHLCSEAARVSGELVWVCSRFPGGVTQARYRQYTQSRPEARKWDWHTMYRNPELYVRGEVRHADHATIHLNSWHRVLMNTENEAPGRRFVAFLD